MIEHRIGYWERPEQVIWVDLPARRLQGFDWYWVSPRGYGVWNDPGSVQYRGQPFSHFAWDGETETQLGHMVIPADAMVYEGYMLTDEQARFVGLL